MDVVAETQTIADELHRHGWCHRPQLIAPALAAQLRADIDARSEQFAPAAIGRADERQQQLQQRRDVTLWLDGSSAAQRDFLALAESIRGELNRQLFLGLFDYEAHYAHYGPGAFYRRHVDAFREQHSMLPRRILSSVFYLNDNWQPHDGGELVLWRDNEELARIPPQAGAAIFFLSADIPHEVLPSRRDRYSIAGWFRGAASA